MYSAVFSAVSVSAIQDLFELNAPSDASIVVHSVTITQSSDSGDAAAELLRGQISRSTGTSGSGGTSVTAAPLHPGDAAFGGTVEANNTTQATTTTVLHEEAFNVQAGWFYRPTPEERITIAPSGRLVVELPGAPADTLVTGGTIIFEAIGG